MRVYLIKQKASDFYKVGFTSKPVPKRLAELQTGNPHELILVSWWNVTDARRVEKHIHEFLSAYHVRGEWFACADEEIRHLQMLLDTKRIS